MPLTGAGIVGLAGGLAIGVTGLRALGLAGGLAGGVVGLMLSSLAVPVLLGLHAPDVATYGEYAPGVAVAVLMAVTGERAGRRRRHRIDRPPLAIVVVGLISLALWLGFWLLASPVARSA